VLDNLLGLVQDDFARYFPMAQRLTWCECLLVKFFVLMTRSFFIRKNTEIFAHENASKYANLQPAAWSGTVQQFADEIYTVTGTSIASMKPVEVHFMFQHDVIVSPCNFEKYFN
jgi:hypothetical protein